MAPGSRPPARKPNPYRHLDGSGSRRVRTADCTTMAAPGVAMKYAASGLSDPARRLRDAEALVRMAASLGRFGAWSIELPTMDLTWSDEVRAIHEVEPGF